MARWDDFPVFYGTIDRLVAPKRMPPKSHWHTSVLFMFNVSKRMPRGT